MYLIFIPAVTGAYLRGSIPFGLLIAKAHGKDLRSIGSGNIGATNVSRALGRKWAYICFALDVLKGMVPMLVIMFIAKTGGGRYAPVMAGGGLCGYFRPYLSDIFKIQRRQRCRNQFWHSTGALALLYNLRFGCRCDMGGSRFDMAVRIVSIHRRFR